MLVEGNLTEDICDQGIDLCGGETQSNPTEALHLWAEDEQLQKAKRLLRPLPVRNTKNQNSSEEKAPRLRFDPPSSDSLKVPLPKAERPPQAAPPKNVPPSPNYPRGASSPTPASSPNLLSGIAWSVVLLGLMGMVCGGVLLAWSMATGRAELWSLGLPIGLVGQGGLLVGMLCAILSKRTTPFSSTQLMGSAPIRVGTPHSHALPMGYSAANESNGPTMLADLRGQLERLSAQMASQESSGSRPWF